NDIEDLLTKALTRLREKPDGKAAELLLAECMNKLGIRTDDLNTLYFSQVFSEPIDLDNLLNLQHKVIEGMNTDPMKIIPNFELFTRVYRQAPEDIQPAILTHFNETIHKLSPSLREDLTNYCFLVGTKAIRILKDKRDLIASIAETCQLNPGPMPKMTSQTSLRPLIFHTPCHKNDSNIHNRSYSEMELIEHALELGLRKLSATYGNEPIQPIFMGVEWAAIALSPNELLKQLDSLAALSLKYPDVLLIPGSIAWAAGEEDHTLAFNTLPVFKGGSLLGLYHKQHESMDIDTIADELGIPKNQIQWPANQLKQLSSLNTSVFRDGATAIATEICCDHAHSTAYHQYAARYPQGQGVDVHLLTAHGSSVNPNMLIAKEGGRMAYIDRSSAGQMSTATIQKKEQRTNLKDKQSSQSNNESFLGNFRTTTAENRTTENNIAMESATLSVSPQGEGLMGLINSIADELDLEPSDLRKELSSHLIEWIGESQQNPILVPENTQFSNPDIMSHFLEKISKRYLFPNPASIFASASGLSSLDLTSEQLADVLTQDQLLRLVSDVYHVQVCSVTDMASIPVQVHGPGGAHILADKFRTIIISEDTKDNIFGSVTVPEYKTPSLPSPREQITKEITEAYQKDASSTMETLLDTNTSFHNWVAKIHTEQDQEEKIPNQVRIALEGNVISTERALLLENLKEIASSLPPRKTQESSWFGW
ncbi:hypothetical protein SCG7086_AH_00010, partial [Chlamydiales bacterium SCGC AG-110-P3]